MNECLEENSQRVGQYSADPRLPPGQNAPSKVVEAKISGKHDFLRSDGAQSLAPQLFGESSQKITSHSRLSLAMTTTQKSLDWGKSFSSNVTMDVSPEVKITVYKGVEVQKKLQPVTDEKLSER